MSLPKTEKRFFVESTCPDCGYKPIETWRAVPIEGATDRLTRKCLCHQCGCWFQEELRLDLQSVDIERIHEDGDEETWAESRHIESCPSCGKHLEETDDTYFGPEEEVECEESKDLEKGIYLRRFFCLDCRVDVIERYEMVRAGTEVIRRGMGPADAQNCPECGSDSVNYTLSKEEGSSYTLRCECQECGCEYQLETVEEHNQTRVVADRDGYYAGSDYESLYFDSLVNDGDECPMCQRGAVEKVPSIWENEVDPNIGRRRSRVVTFECRNCFTEYEDLYDTRVVAAKVLKSGSEEG